MLKESVMIDRAFLATLSKQPLSSPALRLALWALANMDNRKPLPISYIAKQTGNTAMKTSQNLKKLEQIGLVYKAYEKHYAINSAIVADVNDITAYKQGQRDFAAAMAQAIQDVYLT